MNTEIRNLTTDFHVSEDNESRKIWGLAIPVESRSELLYDCFYETISRDALSQEFVNQQDILVYLNHDASQGTYARCKYGQGSMKLNVTERGLEFEFEAPKTAFGDALLEGVRRGDYDAMSFAFRVKQDQWDGEDVPFNRVIREISNISEISILSKKPAYSSTTVDAREQITSLRAYIQQLQEKRAQEEEEEKERISNIHTYYEDLMNEIEKL